MTSPQNTPVGKHAAPQGTGPQETRPGNGNGQGGVPLVRLVNAEQTLRRGDRAVRYHDGGRRRRGHLRAG